MKKYSIILILFLSFFSFPGFAEDSESCECNPFYQVYVPTRDSCFQIYESVLFLRPTSDNLGWGVVTDFVTPNWHIQTIKPCYQPAFNLEFCYAFPCSGIDTELSWTHFCSHDSQSVKAHPALQAVFPFSQTSYDPTEVGQLTKAHASARFEYDVVNWNGGLRVNFGPNMVIRLHSGLGGVRIEEKLSARFGNRGGKLPRISLDRNSSFTGIGPRFGMECGCHVFNHIHFVGGFAATLFFGNLKPGQFKFSGSHDKEISSCRRTHTVPSVEANIGLSYDNCLWGFEYTLEAGYMGAIYINSLSSYEFNNLLPFELDSLSTAGLKHVTSDFALDGPYAKLNVRF